MKQQQANSYIKNYELFCEQLQNRDCPWLSDLRQGALAQLQKNGLPNHRAEDWKYTDISVLNDKTFTLPSTLTTIDLPPIDFIHEDVHSIIFVNGQLHSLPTALTPGLTIQPLNQSYDLIESFIDNTTTLTQAGINALNTLFIDQGVAIWISEGTVLEKPIHLVYLNTEDNTMSHLRNIVVGGQNSQCQIIEQHLSTNSASYFSTSITQIHSAENSQIKLCKIVRESAEGYHISQNNVTQEANSQFYYHSFDLGGKLVRHDVNCELNGAGAHCNLYGLFSINGRQHADTHTRIAHNRSHTYSNEIFKGIADGRSKGVFNGKVFVKQDAQHIVAQQQSKNILLSDRAEIDTKPELEIYANDVQCTHGATVGNLDEDSLFYLQSRGIDRQSAHTMLTYGFAKEMVDRIDCTMVRDQINQYLTQQLEPNSAPRELI